VTRDRSPTIALPRWRAPLGERSDHYLDSLQRADARVLYLAPSPEVDVGRELANVGGLVLSGGIDVDPQLYGQRRHPETDYRHPFRDRYELALLKEALRRALPVLAICRGHQLLNVFMGGKLIQHIVGDSHRAEPEAPRRSAWHEVELAPGSHLAAILGEGRIAVNSRHHQGVAPEMVGHGLRVVALSPDGLVEALEGESQRWLVSVQWHPERPEMAEAMAPLFAAFVEACRKGAAGGPTDAA
jgi:putative glutamine amidotransferase